MEKRPPYFSIGFISAGALAYEILLMRLFSIIHYHHYAYMIISLALLGYGVSGTVVSIAQQILLKHYERAFLWLVFLFSLTSFACFAIAQSLPFNAEEIFWDPNQLKYLFALFIILSIPFLFAASCICLSLRHYQELVPRIYGADLIGAGLGSAGILLLLYVVQPQTALGLVSIWIMIGGIIAAFELGVKRRATIAVTLLILGAALVVVSMRFELVISPYKSLTQTLQVAGTRVAAEYSSPLGLLSVVESDTIPLRHAPGLSLSNSLEPLEQVGVFTDGDNMTVITKKAEKRHQLAYLDQLSSALPYHLTPPKHVLVLGAGGGSDVLQAQYHGVRKIDAVELNPQTVALLHDRYRAYSGDIYSTTAQVFVDDIRGFVSKTDKKYNLIQLILSEGFSGSAAGLYALNENYVYTVEAFSEYMARLAPGGYLAITRWIKIPPRDTLKLFSMATESLKQSGVQFLKQHLVVIRSWQSSTLIVKNGAFSPAELHAVKNFCSSRSFDIVYSPTVDIHQVNRYNVLREPIFYLAAQALVSDDGPTFRKNYKFNITPATDDKPYFNNFFKWAAFKEIVDLRDQGSTPLLESGYLILIVTLIAAMLIGFILIVVPVGLRQRGNAPPQGNKKIPVILFFSVIGLAFLFIEIAFLQKLILLLHHPVFSFSIGLTAFLVFAGLGSIWAQNNILFVSIKKTIRWGVASITILCLFYVMFIPTLFSFLAGSSLAVRSGVSVICIAPLGLCMGSIFPMALVKLSTSDSHLVPWAWGINGCASVIAAVLATLIAIQFGTTLLILLAVVLYAFALLFIPD